MKAMSKATIPTDWGTYEIVAYGDHADDQMPHLAMIHEKTKDREGVLVRIHSECMTGDLFQSHRCECGAQLHRSLELISEHGGILVYLRQEGRGIGLIEKLKAYELQDQGLDTVEANVRLGHAPDERSFDLGIQILNDLDIRSIRLLTNNPDKIKAIEESTIELLERVPIIIEPGASNKHYMQTKKKVLGHLLD